jgi:hypothetical protein
MDYDMEHKLSLWIWAFMNVFFSYLRVEAVLLVASCLQLESEGLVQRDGR